MNIDTNNDITIYGLSETATVMGHHHKELVVMPSAVMYEEMVALARNYDIPDMDGCRYTFRWTEGEPYDQGDDRVTNDQHHRGGDMMGHVLLEGDVVKLDVRLDFDRGRSTVTFKLYQAHLIQRHPTNPEVPED